MPISFLTKGRSKPLKILGFVVAGLLLLLVVIGFFLPSRYKVSRSVVIAAPPGAVYDVVADLRTWEDWTRWTAAVDKSLKRQYSGRPGEEGQKLRWASSAMGSGEMVVTYAKRPEFLEYDLKLDDGYRSRGQFAFEKTAGGTRVTWTVQGDLGSNLPGRYFALGFDSMIGDDFEQGLANLKAHVEAPDE